MVWLCNNVTNIKISRACWYIQASVLWVKLFRPVLLTTGEWDLLDNL